MPPFSPPVVLLRSRDAHLARVSASPPLRGRRVSELGLSGLDRLDGPDMLEFRA